MFYEFLWEGPAKIKQSVAVKEYCEQGGLKMINLKAFMNSMKITWLRRIIVTDSPWQSVIKIQSTSMKYFHLAPIILTFFCQK